MANRPGGEKSRARPAPRASDPAGLAAELELLAGEPRVEAFGGVLRDLAAAVRSGNGLAPWAGGSLVAAYGTAAALGPGGGRRGRITTGLQLASSVMVLFPLLLTWSGLGLAVSAYQDYLDDRGAGRATAGPDRASFLELWQQGFGGHLAGPARFDWLVGYTVLLLTGLVAAGVVRQVMARQDEESGRELVRRLAFALAQTEALAAAAAHTEPRRFATELQSAAEGLRELITLSAGAGDRSRAVLEQATEAARTAVAAVRSMEDATTALRKGTEQVSEASDRAAAAAAGLTRGSELLGDRVAGAVAELAAGMEHSTASSAARITAAAESAAGRFDEVLAGAFDAQARQAVLHTEALEQRSRAAEQLLTTATDTLTAGARDLVGVVAGLDGAVTGLPHALGAAAEEGAERIGTAYELAVAALAASLRGEVEEAAAVIGDRVAALGELIREDGERRASGRRDTATAQAELLAAVEAARGVVDGLAGRVGALAGQGEFLGERLARLGDALARQEAELRTGRDELVLHRDELVNSADGLQKALTQTGARLEQLGESWREHAGATPADAAPAAPAPALRTPTLHAPAVAVTDRRAEEGWPPPAPPADRAPLPRDPAPRDAVPQDAEPETAEPWTAEPQDAQPRRTAPWGAPGRAARDGGDAG
ncbi:hypothetical protein [Kitasatospora sp. NPDC047058]|uniref:hypothetical protein n=1 Tax=Kitasatospora sp. NPDC047058 TaxID=3155620 RepID=UPI0033C2B33C